MSKVPGVVNHIIDTRGVQFYSGNELIFPRPFLWQNFIEIDQILTIFELFTSVDVNRSERVNTRSESMFKNNIVRHKFYHSKSYGPFSEAKTLNANLESTDQIP